MVRSTRRNSKLRSKKRSRRKQSFKSRRYRSTSQTPAQKTQEDFNNVLEEIDQFFKRMKLKEDTPWEKEKTEFQLAVNRLCDELDSVEKTKELVRNKCEPYLEKLQLSLSGNHEFSVQMEEMNSIFENKLKMEFTDRYNAKESKKRMRFESPSIV